MIALFVALATYSVDLRVTRTVTGVRLRVAVSSGTAHAPVRRFALVDGKPMHLFVVGGTGLHVFRHEQPEPQPDGSFSADVTLPEAGVYMAFADFQPEGGTPQFYQQAFTTASLIAGHASEPADEAHVSSGIRAEMDASKVKSGVESALTFDLAEEASGAPVADLERLFGPSGQLFIVSADLTEGRLLDAVEAQRGPRLTFTPVFPRAGRYKMWLQVLRGGGHVATIPFVIDVP